MCNGVNGEALGVGEYSNASARAPLVLVSVHSPARLFRSPSLQPLVHLAPNLLARHESATDAHGAQLLPPGGLVYSLTAAEVVTLPSRKLERKCALRRRSPGTAPYPQAPPFAFFRGKRRRVRRAERRPNQRL